MLAKPKPKAATTNTTAIILLHIRLARGVGTDYLNVYLRNKYTSWR